MKLLAILAASLALVLAGCNRPQNAGAGGTSPGNSSSYKSPSSPGSSSTGSAGSGASSAPRSPSSTGR
ncbi:MAG TPA: hypothetical protein VFV74_07005 [Burkholderiales bacterium]|nr:hypothetical protein [Burkholderiales bacterium]